MAKSVTLNTVQGIGDIFWIYQKLSPYVDELNLTILCTRPQSALQQRSREFCKLLPKVGRVEYVRADLDYYNRVAGTRLALERVLDAPGVVDYAVNRPLEQGVALRDIDPDYPVAEFVDLGLLAAVEQGDYLCAFVSGEQNERCWTARQWVDAIARIAQRIDTRRVALIGASWDHAVQLLVGEKLRAAGLNVDNHVAALGIADSVDVIRGARFFVGYQSGLSVLADNYDVPQLMVYYQSLRPMMFTWCRRENLNGTFNAMTFDDDLDEVLAPIESFMVERAVA